MKTLYLFNPENDMALASGSPYYMAPGSAKKMAADLSLLPAWYAEEGGEVWLPDERQVKWLAENSLLSLPVSAVTGISSIYNKVIPWGWSPSLCHRLQALGLSAGPLPSVEEMVRIRQLSGRQTAVKLLPRLRLEGTVGSSCLLTSLDEVRQFVAQQGRVLLKAPWSGSGKGIRPVEGEPDDSLSGWIRRTIATQGGIVGEPHYQRVVDFAMEFSVGKGEVSFVGYSLFETDARGVYKENVLAPNEEIEDRLASYIGREVLHAVCCRLIHELAEELAGDYQGYLGVDMMICRTSDGFALHPCVEVNLRMNMGVVSRLFYDRYVSGDAVGRYVIEYYSGRGEALEFHRRMQQLYPPKVEDNCICRGYLSLTPVFEDTCYQIYVCIRDIYK